MHNDRAENVNSKCKMQPNFWKLDCAHQRALQQQVLLEVTKMPRICALDGLRTEGLPRKIKIILTLR